MNNSRAVEITRIVLYAMSIFLIVILAILSCQKILDFKYDTQSDEVMLNAIIVSVQILIMVGNAIFNRQVDSVHFGRKNKKNRINKLKSKVYSDVEYARQELRMGLNTIFVLAVLIIVVLMVTTGRIYLSVAAGIIITIAYIYADYIPHAKFYAEKYDRIFCKEKPRAKRGLARIYYNEYKNTKFDDRSSLYKNINTLQEVQLEDLNREYMYCYLWSHLADKKDKSMISFFALFVVNIFTLNPSFYYEITKSLGLRNDVFSTALIVINMLASVTFALLIFAQLPDYDREQDEILMDISSSEDTDEKLLKRYNSLIHENRSQLIQARARFDYTMLKIDDGVTLSEDDLKYQMLFVHKRVPNLQRYNNTVILCAVGVELLIMEFMGMSNYLIAPAIIGIILLMSGKLIVRNIGKRSISRECEMLEQKSKKEEIMSNDMKHSGYPSIDKPWLKYYSEEAINGKLPECSIYEYMYENNKDYPKDIALNYYGRKITYAELFANIDKTAKALLAVGVKEGEIVTVALPSIPEALYVVYALNKIGAVANMIHLLAGKNEIIGYLNEVKSKVAVIFDKTMDILGDGIRETQVKQAIVVTAACSLPFGLKVAYSLKSKSPVCKGIYWNWEEFIKAGEHTELKAYKKDCHTMAIISHTGGTTGEPKGVMCSDNSCNSLMWQLLCNFEYDRQESSLNCLPPFVNYSLLESMMAMLAVGFIVILIPDYKPMDFDKYIKKYHPNEVLSIPAYWEAILRIPNIEKTDMSCLKHVITGGEAMNIGVEDSVNELFLKCGSVAKLCTGLGSTELMAGATLTYDNCCIQGSVGIPMIRVNCKIVEPDTTDELSYNQDGEICFSGPTLMMGYYEKPSATDEVVKVHKDGERWLHTGDIGHIDENGVIYVTGRIKRIIMTKGSDGQVTKLFPDRIEKAVSAVESVELCCVVGVPDEKRINFPKAFVALKTGESASEEKRQEIIAHCKDMLPEYMVPVEIEFRNDLPRTPRGKVDYRALEQEKNSKT